jgi:predicted Zn-dependent peptidase
MPDPWQLTTLPNGLRVVSQTIPTAQSASVNIFAGVGSRAEDRRVNGVSHFLEHMLFKGTPTRPNAIIVSEQVEGAGGTLNAYTSRETTCYWDLVPFDRFETGMDVLCDIYLNALLEQEEVDRERNVVQQEIKRSKDQPGAWAAELASEAVFGDQPIGWPIAGTEETVAGITRQDQADHIATWYVPANTIISVAGNVQHDQVLNLAQRWFGDFPAKPIPPIAAAEERLSSQPIRTDHRDISQCNIQIGMYGLRWDDPDRYALTILTTILGRGMSSRLFKEVRERRGLAYSVGAGHQRHKDCGYLSISAGVSPEKVLEATRVILAEVGKMRAEPVGDEEMTKARDYSTGSFRLGLESSMAVAQRNGDSLIMLGRIEPVEEVIGKLQAVTADDVRAVANRVFRDDNLAIAVVGKGPSEDELANVLKI